MTRQNPVTISTRVDDFTTATLRKMATAEGLSLAAFMRKAVVRFASDPNAQSTRASIAESLGVGPDATDAELLRALEDALVVWGESDAPPPAAAKVSPARVTRPTSAAIDGVRTVAKARRTTPKAMALTALAAIEGASTAAPSREQVAALNDLVKALGLPAGSSRDTVLAAIRGLLDALAEPAPSDPLQQSPDPPALELSAATRAQIKAKGWTIDQFLAARKAAVKRGE